ncbi:MAG: CerR family C-terminal domain-containing protein [Polaromonas sp.]|nr:CerR family C-terminal domain-containing protein [Polaromonas sp.]
MSAPRPASPPGRESRKQRSDGAEARQHLLLTALRLFSEKGFAKTSTRQIALAAGANLASISYYFGDKAGLYLAVFNEPLGRPCDDISRYAPVHLSLRQSLEGYIAGFLDPLKQSELSRQLTRLHLREMIEPSGQWTELIQSNIQPAHTALVEVLCRHLGLPRADDDVHRLAFSISGLPIQMVVTRDMIDDLRPQLMATPQAIDLWASRLADYAEAMFTVELARRRRLPLKKSST